MKNRLAKNLFRTARMVDQLTDILCQGCIYLERGSFHLKRKALQLQAKNMEPNLYQWANRLIEYIDPENIVDAFAAFEKLVRAGIEPSHAFHMVVA